MKKHFEHQASTCAIDNIIFIEVVRNAGFSMSFGAGVSKNKFIYVKNGCMQYLVSSSKEEFLITEGEMLFIPEGTLYTATYLQDNTCAIIAQFDIIYGRLPTALYTPCKTDFPKMDRIMNSLVEKRPRDENYNYFRTCRIHELLWKAADSKGGIYDESRLAPAIAEIENDLAANKKVSHYAALCHMSESGFRRQFTEELGASPIDYRNKLRLLEAERLIATGEYSVEEAAHRVGFNNFSFFCKCFKRQFGRTPKGH